MKEKIYTAPAVVSCAHAVQNTKALIGPQTDGSPDDPGNVPPGSVGFYL